MTDFCLMSFLMPGARYPSEDLKSTGDNIAQEQDVVACRVREGGRCGGNKKAGLLRPLNLVGGTGVEPVTLAV